MADYPVNGSSPVFFEAPKDPSDVKEYAFDWTDALADDSDTISSHTITVEAGLTKDSDTEASGVVTVWLSGGAAGECYDVTCQVVTAAGRTLEYTGIVRVAER